MAGSPTSPFAPGDTPVGSAPVSPFAAGDTAAPAAAPVSPFSPNDTPGGSQAAPVSTSPWVAFRNSAGHLLTGAAKMDQMADNYVARITGTQPNTAFDNAEQRVGPAVSGTEQYQPAPVHQLGSDIANGHPLNALNDAAGVVAGAAPYAVAAIPSVGPVLLGMGGAGNTISARMAAKGETTPTAGDVAAGVASGALNVAGGAAAHGILGPAARAILGPVAGTIGGRIAANSVAGATLGAANQTLATAGTPQFSPADVGNAAVEGAGTGAIATPAMELPGAVAAARRGVVASAMSKVDPVILQSRANVADMIRQAQADGGNVRGQSVDATQAANNVFQSLNTQLSASARALANDPTLTQGQRDGVRTIFPSLSNQAGSAKNTLGLGTDGAPDGSAAQALDQFHQLGIDPAKTAPIVAGLRDLDTLSQNKFLRQTQGPLASLGGKVGKAIPAVAAGVLGAEHGLPEIGLGGLVPGIPELGGKMGTALGGAADRALGNATPPVLKQGDQAAAYLDSLGIPRAPLSLKVLQDTNMARFQAPDAPTPDPAAAAFEKMVQQARIKQATQSNAQALKDQAAQAKATTAQRGADVQAAFALSPEEALKQKLTNSYNTTMATDGLPAAGDTPTIASAVDNELAARRQTIAAKGGDKSAPGSAQATPGTSSATHVAPNAPPTSAAPTEAPGAMSGDRRQSLSDYLTHLAIAAPGGVKLSPEGISQGIDAAAAAGDLNPAQAEFYKGSLNAPMDNASGMHNGNLNTILAHTVALQPEAAPLGGPPLSTGPKGRSSGTPNGGPNPVINAYQARMAAAGYHANAGDSAKIAASAGNLPLSAKIMEIAGEPSVATKQALASEFIGAQNDPIKKAQAQLFLKGRLLTQGK